MAKKRTMDELRQVKDSVYKHPNVDSENPIPTDFWDELSESEKEALHKAQEEAQEEYLNYDEWEEMDNDFYEHLRERFQKGPDEIGPRQWKSFQNKVVPMQLMVIPAGRQHDGEKSVQWFHTIVEDLTHGECNGEYALITETELSEKYNINFNN
jgi:hypothetical protein|tara:strand:- start:1587 stop:2048 length:462 start_codon:yes stop_codon:yes gene_type:complete